MLRVLLLSLIFSLAGCSVAPERLAHLTPAECWAHGVAVQDDDRVSGQIIGSHFGTFATTERECGGSYGTLYGGCAVSAEGRDTQWPSPSGQYVIWYADHKCAPEHEGCHALYEEKAHTIAYNLRQMRGDRFAYCPDSWH